MDFKKKSLIAITSLCLMFGTLDTTNVELSAASKCTAKTVRYSNKKVKTKTTCRNGNKVISRYNTRGRITSKTTYKNGKVNTVVKYKNGVRYTTETKNKYGNRGTVKYYNANDKVSQMRTYDKYGKRVTAKTLYTSRGVKKQTTYYKSGRVSSIKYYFTSGKSKGKVKTVKTYKNGRISTYKTYITNGYSYSDGTLLTKSITYDSKGKYDKVRNYQKYGNGDTVLSSYQDWNNGLKAVEKTYYVNRGNRVKQVTYRNSKYVTKIIKYTDSLSATVTTTKYYDAAHKRRDVTIEERLGMTTTKRFSSYNKLYYQKKVKSGEVSEERFYNQKTGANEKQYIYYTNTYGTRVIKLYQYRTDGSLWYKLSIPNYRESTSVSVDVYSKSTGKVVKEFETTNTSSDLKTFKFSSQDLNIVNSYK